MRREWTEPSDRRLARLVGICAETRQIEADRKDQRTCPDVDRVEEERLVVPDEIPMSQIRSQKSVTVSSFC